MHTTKIFLGVGLGVALLMAAGFYFWNSHLQQAPSTSGISTTTSVGNLGVDLGDLEGADVEIINIENPTIPQPSLDRPVTIDASIPANVAAQLRTNISFLTTELKKDNARLNLWLELGNNRRIAGDAVGAQEAWEYITKVAPSHYLAYSNLGDLYMSVFKDYPKAEANFKKSIELKPTNIDAYRNMYMLYHYLYKTDTAADGDILAAGLKANPNNPDLLQLLGQYQAGN